MSSAANRLPMFPLNTVLFPHAVLPLHVFEPRYLELVSHVLEADGAFGVALIERGSEVGGNDHRFSVGTLARIVRAGTLGEERLAIVAVGVHRIRVLRWLETGPYPLAETVAVPDGEASPGFADLLVHAERAWTRVMAMAVELGASVGNLQPELPDDPRAAMWTLCATAPIEQLDRQRLLEIDDPAERLDRLMVALGEQADTLNARLAAG